MTLKLLVADDSITIQKIVNLAFSGEDVDIEAASDGNSALEAIKRSKPDVVLADIFMPGCSGYEVCERVKEDPELQQIPVILLVGTFEPFDEAEAARVRCDRYLTKPFDTSELIQTIHSLAADRKMPHKEAIAPAKAFPASPKDIPLPKPELSYSSSRNLVSAAARESFLGEGRVLDLFDTRALAAAKAGSTAFDAVLRPAEKQRPETLSEDTISLIVDRVVRKMSPEVIREVAWEVVPELSESIIRRTIEEQE